MSDVELFNLSLIAEFLGSDSSNNVLGIWPATVNK